jgi:hypothetical protein
MRRGDHPIESSLLCKARQRDCLSSGRSGNADAPERSGIHARQYGDTENRWALLLAGHRISRSAHHGDAAQGVDVNHPHLRQSRRRRDRSCDRVGDVVELQIEEYLKAEAREPFNRPRAFRREELEPNFKEARRAAKAPRQGAGRP